MKPLLALTLLAFAATSTVAQTPTRWASYSQVKGHIQGLTVAELANEMFAGAPPEVFVRAGGIHPHAAPWGVGVLWTRPKIVETRASGPIQGVCEVRQATASLTSLEPAAFSPPTIQTLYRAIPRDPVAGPADGQSLEDYCAALDPFKFGSAPDAVLYAEGAEAFGNVLAHPQALTAPNVCVLSTGAPPLCGIAARDVARALTIEVGPCQALARRSFTSAATFSGDRCLLIADHSTAGFQMLIKPGADPVAAYFIPIMTMAYSESFLVGAR